MPFNPDNFFAAAKLASKTWSQDKDTVKPLSLSVINAFDGVVEFRVGSQDYFCSEFSPVNNYEHAAFLAGRWFKSNAQKVNIASERLTEVCVEDDEINFYVHGSEHLRVCKEQGLDVHDLRPSHQSLVLRFANFKRVCAAVEEYNEAWEAKSLQSGMVSQAGEG